MAIKLLTLPLVTITNSNTPYAIYGSAIPVTSVTLQADFTNSAKIVVGGSSVLPTTGVEIPPGDTATIEAPIINGRSEEILLSDIYVASSSGGQTVRAVAFGRKV